MADTSVISRRAFMMTLSAGCIALFSGCGYRLAGERTMPKEIGHVSLRGLAHSEPMFSTFQAQLARSTAQWTEQPRQADVLIVIEDYQLDRRTMVVGPGGAVAEYEIRAEMAFHFRYPQASSPDARSETQYLSHARSVDYDRDTVLASSSNEAEVRREVAERMGRNLFYRLYSAQPPKPR